jgi:hypothetical protein
VVAALWVRRRHHSWQMPSAAGRAPSAADQQKLIDMANDLSPG